MNKDELVKIYVDKTKALDELAKQAYLSNLFAFNQDILHVEEGGEGTGKRVPLKPFHQELCQFIEGNPSRKKIALMPRGHLKAQSLDSKVLTPDGSTTIGDISIGDLVIGGKGKPVKVIGLSAISSMDLWQVTTRDDRKTLCNLDHLWKVTIPSNTGNKEVVKTLGEIKEVYKSNRTGKNNPNPECRVWLTPITVEGETLNLPIDSYTLGSWLGDGDSGSGRITTADPETLNYFPYKCVLQPSYKYNYGILGLRKHLRLSGLLHNKHIPEIYFRSGVEQRLELLRGLMDTDGTCHIDGKIAYFSNIKWELILGVVDLVRSLGGIAKVTRGLKEWKGKPYNHWFVSVKLPKGMNPFRLKRKADLWKGSVNCRTTIIDISFSHTGLGRCIKVDSEDGLYITDDFIPTHNTTLITVGYSLLRIARDPKVRILIANATGTMAEAMLGQIKKHLQYNDTFKYYFGDLSTTATSWRDNMITLPTGDGSYQSKEATVTAYGLGGSLVSQHYDVIVIDDAHNRENINTKDQIEKVKQSYRDLLDLLEPGGQLIIIGTKWHDDDLYGQVMDKNNIQAREFDVFIRRAISEMKLGRETSGHYKIEAGNVLWPEKYSLKALSALLNEKGLYEFSCTPAETPILMADWTVKQICDVKVGDEVIGFKNGVGKGKNKLVKTKVVTKMEKLDVVNDIFLESGRRVRCTADHRWYNNGRDDKTHPKYKTARLGMKLSYVCDPFLDLDGKDKLWWYLGGMIDGEGSFKSGGLLTISQSDSVNPDVFAKIVDVLNKLGIDYKIYNRKAYGIHNSSCVITLRKTPEIILKLIRYIDFGKRQQAIDWMYRKNSRMVKEKDRIIKILQGILEPVYALETETGNYIAWGYASSNCQYQNIAVDDENAVFHKNWFHEYDPTDLRDRKLSRFTAIDPAISLKDRADFTAIVTIGVDVLNKIYILEVKRGHYTEDQMVDELFLTNEKYHPLSICIETVAFQKTLQHYIMKEIKRRGHSLPLNEVLPESDESKEKRIRLLQPIYMRGDILHSKSVADIEYLEDELLRFPKGKHDDLIDALSYAVRASFPPRQKDKSENSKGFLY